MTAESVTWRALLDEQYWPRLVLLSFALWLHATNTMLTSTTLPSVVESIGGHRLLSWAFSLYLIGSVVSGTQMSVFVRRLGFRNTIVGAAITYLVGCVICGFAGNMPVFLLGRVVQGLGGGGLVSLVYLSQHQFFPNQLIPRIIASNSVVWMGASFCGPMIGGMFATYGLWRLGFLFFALQALLFIVYAALQLQNEETQIEAKKRRVSTTNLGVLCASIVFVAFAGTLSGWLSSALFVVLGVVCLYLFILLDSRIEQQRMLPKSMLNLNNPVASGLLMTLVYSAALMSFVVYGPVVLTNVYGLTPLATGFVLITEAVAWSTSAIIFADKSPSAERKLILVGGVFVTIGISLQAVVVPATSVMWIVLVLVIGCGGFGAIWGYVIRRVVESASLEDKDRASSMLPVTQQIGFALGAAYAGVIANGLGYSALSSVQEIQRIAAWVLYAFVPFAAIGNVCTWLFVQQHVKNK